MIGLDPNVPLGVTLDPDGLAHFLVWAPSARSVGVELLPPGRRRLPLEQLERGYWGVELDGIRPGQRYGWTIHGRKALPDPASRSQPNGVVGASEVVAPDAFRWTDASWQGLPLDRQVFYELHVGTYSRSGTFDGVVLDLDHLADLGVTTIEILPVAQFSGRRNWGYDGVFPFAVQHSYGGLAGLQRLADACHARGLALFLDVVYNHLGPEGNVLPRFGPYFTDRYRTPWGAALNFDGHGSDEVRRFFVESATFLTEHAHLDGLRVDAVHAIVDPTARPFLAELTHAVHAVGERTGRPRWLVAESALNDPRVVERETVGGLGFDTMWNDDFHHALHAALTGDRSGYFVDFHGVDDLQQVLVHGFALAGRRSEFRGRRHGRAPDGVPAERFVAFAQNHDQVGNRPFGDRLGTLVPFAAEKLAMGLTVLAPFLPLLFMGQEYGETAPFLYFTDHQGRRLARAVCRGRRREFVGPTGGTPVPDPQSTRTFELSRLVRRRRARGRHRAFLELTRALLALRREIAPVRRLSAEEVGRCPDDPSVLWIDRPEDAGRPGSFALFRIGPGDGALPVPELRHRQLWRRLDAEEARFGGSGSTAPDEIAPGHGAVVGLAPWSFVVYTGSGGRGVA
ncbi:MAG: malto-oligosyltrehalose trehalohydrolase [Thermoplasmata archaeon]